MPRELVTGRTVSARITKKFDWRNVPLGSDLPDGWEFGVPCGSQIEIDDPTTIIDGFAISTIANETKNRHALFVRPVEADQTGPIEGLSQNVDLPLIWTGAGKFTNLNGDIIVKTLIWSPGIYDNTGETRIFVGGPMIGYAPFDETDERKLNATRHYPLDVDKYKWQAGHCQVLAKQGDYSVSAGNVCVNRPQLHSAATYNNDTPVSNGAHGDATGKLLGAVWIKQRIVSEKGPSLKGFTNGKLWDAKFPEPDSWWGTYFDINHYLDVDDDPTIVGNVPGNVGVNLYLGPQYIDPDAGSSGVEVYTTSFQVFEVWVTGDVVFIVRDLAARNAAPTRTLV